MVDSLVASWSQVWRPGLNYKHLEIFLAFFFLFLKLTGQGYKEILISTLEAVWLIFCWPSLDENEKEGVKFELLPVCPVSGSHPLICSRDEAHREMTQKDGVIKRWFGALKYSSYIQSNPIYIHICLTMISKQYLWVYSEIIKMVWQEST